MDHPIVLLLVGVSLFAVLLALGFFISIGLGAYKRTLFTIIECKITLIIKDTAGSDAEFRKSLKLKANHTGLSQFDHRNLSADGSFSDFKVNGIPVQPKKDAGDFIVEVRFPPLKRGAILSTDLSLRIRDSFPSTTEAATYLVAHPTEKLVVEIHLPDGRPAQEVRVYRRRGGETDTNVTPEPKLAASNTRIAWEASNLKDLGAEYIVEWVWPPKG
jgi:hypothetical protein